MIILCDLDHTLADARHRDHLLGRWDIYYDDAHLDPPVTGVIALVTSLARSGHKVIILTAREEKHRLTSTRWLVQNGVKAEAMFMRPDNNYDASPALKLKLAREHLGEELLGVGLVIDDREDVLEVFRALHITTMRVDIGKHTDAHLEFVAREKVR